MIKSFAMKILNIFHLLWEAKHSKHAKSTSADLDIPMPEPKSTQSLCFFAVLEGNNFLWVFEIYTQKCMTLRGFDIVLFFLGIL